MSAAQTRFDCESAPNPNPWLSETAVIREITAEVEGVATYHLAFVNEARGATYRFQPGQFNMLYLPGAGEVPISLSADPESAGTWAHTVRAVGNVTKTLARLKLGDTLGLRGPYGSGWPLAECVGRDVLIIAGGLGLAPLRPAIYHLLRQRGQFGRVWLLYGSRSPELLLYEREYPDWITSGISVEVTVDRAAPGWQGNVGVVTVLVEQLSDFDPAKCVVLCCGPEVMMRFAAQGALRRGVPASRVWVSLERNMQCAVGFCGHCQLGPEFVCKDGPVIRYDRVASWLKVEGL
ncbi:Anaerobic sulfite reductase subunit B [Anatilimnocola aggregata]|uniref:Anaerobic sulfite reductase subunit B n=1 Tax=Anatilimnocola aggregata TaxID=2528021 RepID=A0A517YAC9_9BACT|nr:FAD/NAD(P)-binding protein [Anatilimnocola aggregata]QDU27197.1 Anaerobic sulfite reductase subunit B [Anatilimnocola aggregata]